MTMLAERAAPTIIKKGKWIPEQLDDLVRHYDPKTDVGKLIRTATRLLPPDQARDILEAVQRSVVIESALSVNVIRGRESRFLASSKEIFEEYGVVCRKVVTTAGVGFIVDAFQNLVELENMKFHGIGTGTVAEAVGDTALGAELTTQYNPDNTRATGSTTEGASANVYRTVGTNTLDSGAPAVTEHGIFSAASAGVLLDRSVFAAINLDGVAGDGLQTTYDCSFASGG